MTKQQNLDEILDNFFVLRSANAGDDLDDIKARNEAGEPTIELKHLIESYTKRQVIEGQIKELTKLTNLDRYSNRQIFAQKRISELKANLNKELDSE